MLEEIHKSGGDADKFLAKLLLPVLAKKVVEKASKQFEQQQNQQSRAQEIS